MKKEFKVVGVISSARAGSNSAAMVREALRGARETGAAVSEICLPDYRLEFCKGCLACMKEGKCPLRDDFESLREQLYAADGIIWGSPTYAGMPNAIMKNLIDRLGLYEVTTSSLGGKYMAGISSANRRSAAEKVAAWFSRFGSGGTFQRSYSSGRLGVGFAGGRKAEGDEKVLRKAKALGNKMANDIINANKYPLQNIFGRIITSLVTKPMFSKYIIGNKDGDTKVIYLSLQRRNLIKESAQ